MQFLRGIARRRALKKLGRELPRRLLTDYGASDHFTPGQVRTALSKLGIAPEFFVFGYAMFLTEAAFDGLRAQSDGAISYRDARAEFLRHSASRQPDSEGPYDFSADWSNVQAGTDVSGHPASGGDGGGH